MGLIIGIFMIIHFQPSLSETDARRIASKTGIAGPVHIIRRTDALVMAFEGGEHIHLSDEIRRFIVDTYVIGTQYQLCSRNYNPSSVSIHLKDVVIGASSELPLISGPCAVESREQMNAVCASLVAHGLHILRAGCFKPRTSIYSFQGLGAAGLDILREMRDKYGLLIATEVCEPDQLDAVCQVADIVQIGAKSMHDYQLLRLASQIDKPVIFKRHYAARLEEFAQMADLLMCRGKEDIILCERGIRTFETATRFTLDLGGVVWLKRQLRLPVIVDPSHAFGYHYGVIPLAKAAAAMGADGIMVETHPHPQQALSDSKQQLNMVQLNELINSMAPIADAINKKIV